MDFDYLMDAKKKIKSMYGSALRKGEKPPSMQEIVEELRRDRKDCSRRIDEMERIASAWEKYRSEDSIPNNFNDYVKFIQSTIGSN